MYFTDELQLFDMMKKVVLNMYGHKVKLAK